MSAAGEAAPVNLSAASAAETVDRRGQRRFSRVLGRCWELPVAVTVTGRYGSQAAKTLMLAITLAFPITPPTARNLTLRLPDPRAASNRLRDGSPLSGVLV
jgi:hypothetical protein